MGGARANPPLFPLLVRRLYAVCMAAGPGTGLSSDFSSKTKGHSDWPEAPAATIWQMLIFHLFLLGAQVARILPAFAAICQRSGVSSCFYSGKELGISISRTRISGPRHQRRSGYFFEPKNSTPQNKSVSLRLFKTRSQASSIKSFKMRLLAAFSRLASVLQGHPWPCFQ
jgi:hypothetical protein